MTAAVILSTALAGADVAPATEMAAAAPSEPAAAPRTSWQRTVAVYGAVYGSLYAVAFTASNIASLTIMSVTSPAWLPVAMSFGMPAVMVGVMSQAVPKLIEAVPPAVIEMLADKPPAAD